MKKDLSSWKEMNIFEILGNSVINVNTVYLQESCFLRSAIGYPKIVASL